MHELSIRKDRSKEYVLLKPVWAHRIIFPVLAGVICLILVVMNIIHYPQTVNAHVIFTGINPAGNVLSVEIDVPEGNIYQLDEAQPIQLWIADYPYARFGTLTGSLKYISGITIDNNIKAQIYLPQGLRTSGRYPIDFRRGLKADALIVIRDMRLIQRIFSSPARAYR